MMTAQNAMTNAPVGEGSSESNGTVRGTYLYGPAGFTRAVDEWWGLNQEEEYARIDNIDARDVAFRRRTSRIDRTMGRACDPCAVRS